MNTYHSILKKVFSGYHTRKREVCFVVALIAATSISGCSTLKNGTPNWALPVVSKEEAKNNKQLKADTLFISANKQKILENYEEARVLFHECLALDESNSAAMFELAKIYQEMKKYDDALDYAKKASEADPKNKWYRELYATLLKWKQEYKLAANIYEELIISHPDNYDYYLEWAYLLINDKRYGEAINVFNKLEEISGIDYSISYQKEQLFIKMNKFDEAVKEIERLINAYPEEVEYEIHLAGLYKANEYYDKALEIYRGILEKAPDNAMARFAIAEYYKSQGDHEKYLETLNLVFKSPEFETEEKIKVLFDYFTDPNIGPEQLKEALILCKTLVETHPNEARAYVIYGDFYREAGLLDEALTQYLRAVKLDNSKFNYWEQIFDIETNKQKYDSLIKHTGEALVLFPSNLLIYYYKTFGLMQKKRYQEVIETSEQGLVYATDDRLLMAGIYANLGEAYYQLSNFTASDSAFEKSLLFDYKNTMVLNNYSYYLSLRAQNLEKARDMAEDANTIEPGNPSFEDTYGWILYKLGDIAEARKWIEKAIQHGGQNNAVIIEHLGDVVYKLGDIEEAVRLWKQAKELGLESEFINKKISDRKLYE